MEILVEVEFVIVPLATLIEGVFEKNRLLDIIKNFTVSIKGVVRVWEAKSIPVGSTV